MRILGIESSCDDTAAALVSTTPDPSFPRRGGFRVLAEKTAGQVDVHKKYGGVVPEIAGRLHAENIMPVIEAVLKGQKKPDAIAVTAGPGLITGLIVGVEAARALSYAWDIPLIGVNHIEGHIHSVEITNNQLPILNKIIFPALCLIVSGGHTELILMTDRGKHKKIGKTRDDAAGECFDKVGKLLGFDYPGGPKISAAAVKGNPSVIDFPRPMLNSGDYDFSFAGLKTAALYWLRDNESRIRNQESGTAIADICASFEQAIIDTLVHKTVSAAKEYRPRSIILAGGVAANLKLRSTLQQSINRLTPIPYTLYPRPSYCMDNGAMIAAAGYYHLARGESTPWRDLRADPQWEL